jgi:hypothetical protein
MITYRYSLIKDTHSHVQILRELRWLKEHRIKLHYPNLRATLSIIFNRPTAEYQCEEDITCYWVTAGNFGS